MWPRNTDPEQPPKERQHWTVIAADATNPDGTTTFVACLDREPRHFTCGVSPIEAIGAFVVLHHDLIGVKFVEVGLGQELPKIPIDGEMTIGIIKVAEGYAGFFAQQTTSRRCCDSTERQGNLDWTAVSTEPTASRAAGVVLRRYGWAIDVIVQSLSDQLCEPAIATKPSETPVGAEPQAVVDDGGSGCCSGTCGL